MTQRQKLDLRIEEKEAEGTYSNMVFISHSPAEFIIDFARIMPGVPKAKVHARIIMTPQHTKMFFKALEDNLKKFEQRFGEIKIPGEMEEKGIGFRG